MTIPKIKKITYTPLINTFYRSTISATDIWTENDPQFQIFNLVIINNKI